MPRPISPLEFVPASQMGNPSLRRRAARNGGRSRRKKTALCERVMRNMERSGPKSSRTPFSRNRSGGRRIYGTGSGMRFPICTRRRGTSLDQCPRRRGSWIPFPPCVLLPTIKYLPFALLDPPGGKGPTRMKACSEGVPRASLRARPTRVMRLRETRWMVISWTCDRVGLGREGHLSHYPWFSGMWL